MKKNFPLYLLIIIAFLATDSVSNAQSRKIIHYWHFNCTTINVHMRTIAADYSAPGNGSVSYIPKPGAGSDTSNVSDYMDNVTGDTINQRPGYLGSCSGIFGVRTRNPSDNMQFLWYIPTKNYQNIVIKYETQSSGTASGQHRQLFSYSTDSAATFTSAGLPVAWDSAGLGWGKVTLDLSSLASVNNNGKFFFRILFTAPNTSTSGNNRFDNITVEGDSMTGPAFTSTPLTTGIIKRPYSYTITTTGSPDPAISVSGNPAWLTLSGNILSGTPSSMGTYGPIIISAENAIGTVKQQFNLDIADSINPVAPSITSSPLTSVKKDSLYTYTVSATGVPKPVISVTGNPSWLVLNDSVLSGVPQTNGVFGPIVIKATNVQGSDTQSFNLTVVVAPVITGNAVTEGVVNKQYVYSVETTATPAANISVSGNPSWLALNGKILSGTPLSTGTFGPITVSATNTEGTVQQIFSIVVSSVPVITSSPVTTGTAGSSYSYTVTSTGTPAPVISMTGNPSWLNINGSVLSGIPTSSGLIGPVNIIATNVASADTQSIYLHIANPSVNTRAFKVLYYWDFNNTMPPDGTGGINLTSTNVKADYSYTGKESLVYRPWPGVKDPGILDNLIGDTINQRSGIGGCCGVLNNAVRTRNPSDSMDLLLYLPTNRYRNIVIKYETQISSLKSGQHEQIFSYSTDSAATFITSGLPVVSNFADTLWGLVTLDLRSLTAINNNDKFVFKIYFSAPNTGNKGNNRFDNLTVEGDSIVDADIPIEFQANMYTLYPNPVREKMKIKGIYDGEKTITIYNSVGIQLNTITVSGTEPVIDVSYLNPGFYFIKIREKGGTGYVNLRFIKN